MKNELTLRRMEIAYAAEAFACQIQTLLKNDTRIAAAAVQERILWRRDLEMNTILLERAIAAMHGSIGFNGDTRTRLQDILVEADKRLGRAAAESDN